MAILLGIAGLVLYTLYDSDTEQPEMDDTTNKANSTKDTTEVEQMVEQTIPNKFQPYMGNKIKEKEYLDAAHKAVETWNNEQEFQIIIAEYTLTMEQEIVTGSPPGSITVTGYYTDLPERPSSFLGNWGSQHGHPDFEVQFDFDNPALPKLYLVK